ncbi:hypothetical protein F4604DRAFT_1943918 [Suillus subluteus]|nr:hypothetical protein F4604DRAFT_1943918 [Suillus subluteus]
MHPSCNFRQWSTHDARKLLKVKGTIEDVDGECYLKVPVHSRKGCPIAPHYRLPLYALNKKFGIYRKVVEHLQTLPSIKAAAMRHTYLSVMQYLNDAEFRSATLDYYLWLDHTCNGFHDGCREALDTTHGVTFERLKNGECSDILVFLNWTVYHEKNCKEHDFCGVIQGSGAGEDLKSLLEAVNASVNVGIDQTSTTASHPDAETTEVSDDVDVNSGAFPKFPLPFDMNYCNLALSTLGRDASQMIIGGIDRWLPSHIAMRFREIQRRHHYDPLDDLASNGFLVTVQNTDEYLEIFGMVEMMDTCSKLSKDRSSMARFFTAAGRALYRSRQGKICVVEYDDSLIMSQLMADDGTPKDVNLHRDPSTAISVGVQCDSVDLQYDSLGVQCDYIGVRYDSLGVQCDYIGMRYDSIGVQCDYIGVRYDSIGVQCDSNEESIIQLSGSHSTPDRKVQTNIEGQDTLSMDDDNYVMYEPAVELDCDNSLHNEYQLNENYDACDPDRYAPSSANYSDHSTDASHIALIPLGISSSVNSDVSDSSSSGCNQSNSHETLQEIPIPISPPLKSRLRQNPRAVAEKTPAGSYLRQGSSKPGRPVVFATQRPVVTAKAKGGVKQVRSPKYTIQDLVCESQTGGGNVTPFISSFLMDSDGMEFVRSTISSRHDSWLCIARHIASLLRRECLSGAMKRMRVH